MTVFHRLYKQISFQDDNSFDFENTWALNTLILFIKEMMKPFILNKDIDNNESISIIGI